MGLQLKFRRLEKGFKQYELARKVGISPQYLRLLETGKANPSRELMIAISKELDSTVGELFFNENKEE